MKVTSKKTRIFKEGANLADFVQKHLPSLKEESIVVVTSKIVALAEKRTVELKTLKEKIALIKSESQFAIRTKYVWMTIKDGAVMANAGIDESNADGKIILLPKDSFAAARKLRKKLQHRYGLKKLGVLITDSRTVPLRAGVMGTALGYAGFAGIRDYRGKADIFGRALKMTRTDVADSLAASAVLLMGEGAECKPLALIENAPVEFNEKTSRAELFIAPADDMYGPLFRRVRS